jgi:hypothetical protein
MQALVRPFQPIRAFQPIYSWIRPVLLAVLISSSFSLLTESHQAKQLHLKTTIKARLGILILSKTYSTKVTSRHVGLLAGGFVFSKSN